MTTKLFEIEEPILKVLRMPDPDELHKFQFMEDWYFHVNGIRYMIPKGFISDGASIPKPLRMIVNPTGYLFLPSFPHDFAYKNGYMLEIWPDMNEALKSPISRIRADFLFKELANELYPMKSCKTALAYQGLKVGGGFAWKNHRKNDKQST